MMMSGIPKCAPNMVAARSMATLATTTTTRAATARATSLSRPCAGWMTSLSSASSSKTAAASQSRQRRGSGRRASRARLAPSTIR